MNELPPDTATYLMIGIAVVICIGIPLIILFTRKIK